MSDTPELTILNVDDDDSSRYATSRVLRQAGFEIIEAANGAEALRLVKENPDLVILDINLPDMNGFEVCERIKADPATSLIPVLHLSAIHLDDQATVKGLESGADGYLTHPIEPPVLVAYVKALLRARQAEAKVLTAAREWRTTFDTISDAVCLVDMEGRVLRCNEAMTKLVGMPFSEIIGHTPDELSHPALDFIEQSLLARLREIRQRESVDLPMGKRWFNVTVDPLLDEGGDLISAVHIIADITERKRVAEALRTQRDKFEGIIASMADGLDIVSRDYRIHFQNKMLKDRFGDLTGKLCYEGYMARETPCESCPMVKAIATGSTQSTERTGADGREYEVTSTPFQDVDGETKVVEVVRDITERKQAEEALQESEERYRQLFEDSPISLWEQDFSAVKQRIEALRQQGVTDLRAFFEGHPEVTAECVALIKNTATNKASLKLYAAGSKEELLAGLDRLIPPEVYHVFQEELVWIAEGRTRFELESVNRTLAGERIGIRLHWSVAPGYEDTLSKVLVSIEDITERVRAEEKLQQSNVKLQRAFEGTVNVLVAAIEMGDPYTAGHQQRVTQLACAIAHEMGLPEEQIEGLHMAGLIHDLGKINVPSEILSRPGPLSDLQFGLVKMHAQTGHDVLKKMDFPWPVADIVLQHHERMDGSGYPQGLSGEGILLEARILAAADVVEAMASSRPYRPALGVDKALEEIYQNRGILYDPEAANACLKLFTEKGFAFE